MRYPKRDEPILMLGLTDESGQELSGNGYQRRPVVLLVRYDLILQELVLENKSAVRFPRATAPWSDVTGLRFFGPDGHVIADGPCHTGQSVDQADMVEFASGQACVGIRGDA